MLDPCLDPKGTGQPTLEPLCNEGSLQGHPASSGPDPSSGMPRGRKIWLPDSTLLHSLQEAPRPHWSLVEASACILFEPGISLPITSFPFSCPCFPTPVKEARVGHSPPTLPPSPATSLCLIWQWYFRSDPLWKHCGEGTQPKGPSGKVMGHHGYLLSSISSGMRVDMCSLLGGPCQPQQTSKPWELGKMAAASATQPCPTKPTLVRYPGLTSLQRKSLLVA